MGNNLFKFEREVEWKPNSKDTPSYDPNYGFSKERKPRVMVATEEEMRAAKIPLKDRDYCAHFLIEYESCKRTYWPFVVMCKPEKHQYLDCEYDDYVLRMKECEREKRLRLRRMRLEGQ